MKKPILILIALAIIVSIITSSSCGGPIDLIFAGWRDTTACDAQTRIFDFVPSGPRDSGVYFLIFSSIALLVLAGFFFGLLKVFVWFKNR